MKLLVQLLSPLQLCRKASLRTHLDISSEADGEGCGVLVAVVEVLEGQLRVYAIESLQCAGLVQVVVAVVDERHPVQVYLHGVPLLILYRLPQKPAKYIDSVSTTELLQRTSDFRARFVQSIFSLE